MDRRSAALAPSLLCRPAAEPTAVPPAAPTDIGPSISISSASASVVTAAEAAAAAADAIAPGAADSVSDAEMDSAAAVALVSEDPRLSLITPLREWVRDHFPLYHDVDRLDSDSLFLEAICADYKEAHDVAMDLVTEE